MSNINITKEEIAAIFPKVADTMADALGCDVEKVKPDASLINDLGVESIDFLDIVFKLEKAFGIEIPRKELSPEDILTNAEFVQDGKVTAAGIAELKRRMPFVNFAKFEANPQVREFSNLLTVGDLCRYVESKDPAP